MKNVALELQPCVKQRSGVGVYTYELARRLNSNTEISYSGNVFNFMNKLNIEKELSELSFSINTNLAMPYGVYRRIWKYLPISYNRLFHSKADIYHFFNYIVPPRIKGRVITTIHDLAYLLYPETMDPKNLKRITDDIEYSINRSDVVIAVSEYTKQLILEKYDVPESKVKVIYNSFSISKEVTSYDILKSKYDLFEPYILYVGNLEPRKNISRLIEAFSSLKHNEKIPHKLVIVGQKGWLFDDIFKTLEDIGIKDDVIFTGFVDDKDKTSFYKNADTFVYPSLYEGFGIPILEAMAMGTPVVCSNTSSMPEVGGDAAVYVDPLSVDSIAEGIWSVLSDKELADSKIKLGYEQIKKFSWDDSARKLEEIYKSI